MDIKEIHWLYENSSTNKERYFLGEHGDHMIACIGVNPSTASPNNLDPTLKKVKKIASFNGFDGWIMYNVYPQRATDPNALDSSLNTDIYTCNLKSIRASILELNIKTVWLAYGDLIAKRDYLYLSLFAIYDSLKDLDLNWCIINSPTKKGHPRHPLYQKSASNLLPFDMSHYIDTIVGPKLPS